MSTLTKEQIYSHPPPREKVVNNQSGNKQAGPWKPKPDGTPSPSRTAADPTPKAGYQDTRHTQQGALGGSLPPSPVTHGLSGGRSGPSALPLLLPHPRAGSAEGPAATRGCGPAGDKTPGAALTAQPALPPARPPTLPWPTGLRRIP